MILNSLSRVMVLKIRSTQETIDMLQSLDKKESLTISLVLISYWIF